MWVLKSAVREVQMPSAGAWKLRFIRREARLATANQDRLRWALVTLLVLSANSAAQGAIVTTPDITFSFGFATSDTLIANSRVPIGVPGFDLVSRLWLDRDVDGIERISNTSRIQADFPNQLNAPGAATINLRQIPIRSAFSTEHSLLAEISLLAGSSTLASTSAGLDLDVNVIGTGSLTTISGSDAGGTNEAVLGVPGLLNLTIDYFVEQTRSVDFAAIEGLLVYRNRNTLAGGGLPFRIDSSTIPDAVNVLLNEPGIYDFQLVDPVLRGTITDRLDATLQFQVIIIFPTPRVDVPLPPQTGSIPYSIDSEIVIPNWFSIEVLAPTSDPPDGVVPEPASCVVWIGLAAAGCVVIRRGPRRATEKDADKS
jgi:hypothetical protein